MGGISCGRFCKPFDNLGFNIGKRYFGFLPHRKKLITELAPQTVNIDI